MRHLHLDIETYSEVSIADCGAYRYAMDESFQILLVAYAYDDEPTQIIDMGEGQLLPEWLVRDLMDAHVVKHAHNATFERVCFTMWLRRRAFFGQDEWLDPAQWRCSMVLASRCGLPQSLKQVGEVLRLSEQKMSEGRGLIKLFCTPHVAGGLFERNGRVLPHEHPDEWETFKAYCIRDVDVERAIEKACSWYETSDDEHLMYAIDQRINDRGVRVDDSVIDGALFIQGVWIAKLHEQAVKLTGLSNPSSVAQLKKWVGDQMGVELTALNKEVLQDILANRDCPAVVRQVIALRAEMGKTSTAKYGTMRDYRCPDGRMRGIIQFYGTRTGRWAGKGPQLQNLPQNHLNALDAAREAVRERDLDLIRLGFGNVQDTLSQLIRTVLVPSEGKIFAVCDFSAIEARVLAWLAGEEWVLDVFRKGGDIYCATASQMFKVPVEKHGVNAHLRQKGKVAVLALGYQGGPAALDRMGGQRLGMTVEEERETVSMWRQANPSIKAFWGRVEAAAKECVVYRTRRTVTGPYASLDFDMVGDTMTITLPSGRRICYPSMELSFEGNDRAFKSQTERQAALGYCTTEKRSLRPAEYIADGKLRFRGLNQETRKWEWVDTYGGKLTENITQAVGRDCLAHVMKGIEAAGFGIVFHVHDELVMEADDRAQLAQIESIFSQGAPWAEGLPLRGAGYTGNYYFKD